MKQAKVLEVIDFNEWDWPHGKLYYINMKMDNWETISLGKKKSDAFKAWDTICYEDYTDAKWRTKQREVKEAAPEKKSYSSDNWRGAFLWMAIKIAFEKLYDAEKENYTETMALAGRIYEDAINLYNNSGTEEETAKNDALPF